MSRPGPGGPGGRPASTPGPAPRLEVEGLGKRFGGVVALDGVDLEVGEAEVVGLVGPNGAGKTTLFNCLLGVERPDRGQVRLDGADVTGLPVYRRARLGLARTFQRVELFADLSVRQHLLVAARARSRTGRMLGRGRTVGRDRAGRGGDGPRWWPPGPAGPRPGGPADEVARAQAILDLLGLVSLADVPAQFLGLGSARLVELARALATDPSVVLADEPSSGLDEGERETLARALVTVSQERRTAVVLIEHDLDLVRRVAGRLYVLELGSIIAEGPTESVLADPKVADAYRGSAAGHRPVPGGGSQSAPRLSRAHVPGREVEGGP